MGNRQENIQSMAFLTRTVDRGIRINTGKQVPGWGLPLRCRLVRKTRTWVALCRDLDLQYEGDSPEAARLGLQHAIMRMWDQDEERLRKGLRVGGEPVLAVVLEFGTEQPARRICLQCGYPVEGLSGNLCPECGTTFDPDDLKTFALEEDPTLRRVDRLGRSVQWQAGCQFIVIGLLMLLARTLNVDVFVLIVWALGDSVRQGSRRAAKWAAGFSMLYVVVWIGMIGTAISRGQAGLVGDWFALSRDRPPLAVLVAFGVWALVNAVLLIQFLRESSEQDDPAEAGV